MKFISIGSHCTTTDFLKRLGLKGETFPFDWMFSTPEFVYKTFKQILIDDLDINSIIYDHFFKCDTMAYQFDGQATYKSCPDVGKCPANTKTGVCFPHDGLDQGPKYVRRMVRLKGILKGGEPIHFIYVPLVPETYSLDGMEYMKDERQWHKNLYDLLSLHNVNFKMTVFCTDDVTYEEIQYIKISKVGWPDFMSQLVIAWNKGLQD